MVGLIGKPVTLSFKIKVTSVTKLNNIKAAIVQWTGSIDSPTRDIVSTWNAVGANPTLGTGYTYVNTTPVNLGIGTSWTNVEITGTVSVSAKNLTVFIWSDVTDVTLNDAILVTDVQLETGSVASPYDRLPIDIQLERCLRYTYGLWQTTAYAPFGIGLCTATNKFDTILQYPVPMRITPTLGTITLSAGNTFRIYVNAGYIANSIVTSAITRNAIHIQATRDDSSLPSGSPGLFQDAGTAAAYVVISAELGI